MQSQISEYEAILFAQILHKPTLLDKFDIPDFIFFTPAYKAGYRAIIKARESFTDPDTLMIIHALRANGDGEHEELISNIRPPAIRGNQIFYLNHLHEYYRKCEIKTAIAMMQEAIEDPQWTAEELADKALENISDAMLKTASHKAPTLKELMAAYIDAMNVKVTEYAKHSSKNFGLGYFALDKLIGPLLPGEVIIVAARPGCGKTSFALQAAEHVTSMYNLPAAYFSMEMTAFDMMDRIIAMTQSATVRELRAGSVSSSQLELVMNACSHYYNSLLAIYEGSPTPAMLHSRIRREVAMRGTRLIVVDYLGLIEGMGGDGKMARWERVGEESRALKRLALELKIDIILCVQLGRDADGTEPSIAMLRDSGSIEQDADRVILLYTSQSEANNEHKQVHIKVGKNRHGATGEVTMMFDGPHVRFYEEQGIHE